MWFRLRAASITRPDVMPGRARRSTRLKASSPAERSRSSSLPPSLRSVWCVADRSSRLKPHLDFEPSNSDALKDVVKGPPFHFHHVLIVLEDRAQGFTNEVTV